MFYAGLRDSPGNISCPAPGTGESFKGIASMNADQVTLHRLGGWSGKENPPRRGTAESPHKHKKQVSYAQQSFAWIWLSGFPLSFGFYISSRFHKNFPCSGTDPTGPERAVLCKCTKNQEDPGIFKFPRAGYMVFTDSSMRVSHDTELFAKEQFRRIVTLYLSSFSAGIC